VGEKFQNDAALLLASNADFKEAERASVQSDKD
jgi:hypothetical protein